VKVVMIAESFLPHMNGVTNSMLQMLRVFEHRGHETLVIAPQVGHTRPQEEALHGASTALLRSVPLPGYPEVRVSLAGVRQLGGLIRDFRADVAHLASPFVLGWQGLRAAESVGVPTVAVYQTDVPGYAKHYGIPAAAPALERHVARIHRAATLTLAPSSAAMEMLAASGVGRLRLWARGVDGERFHPGRRSAQWRSAIAPDGEVIVGYVGRLAPEKQVADLKAIADLPGIRLVIIGDGPSRAQLEHDLPDAVFTGFLGGDELAVALAGFDLFVHPGESESFCQSVQEALASGVPVVSTGRGGPLDLVRNSQTGWLYRPGDLADLRARVLDLVGDAGKRRAFAAAARESVTGRTWERLGEQLVGHYEDAIDLRRAGEARFVTGAGPRSAITTSARPADAAASAAATAAASPPVRVRPKRYVAVGDSLTEGLCDDSRQRPGEFRGWADRLAHLLAHGRSGADPLLFANLAVRSKRVADVVDDQLPRALTLRPDLVSVLVGGNDLVGRRERPERLADRLGAAIADARASGSDVLVVTAFTPPFPLLLGMQPRFAAFNRRLADTARDAGAIVLEFWDDSEFLDHRMWASDRVHMSSAGHRLLSYRAADALGVPDARALGELDAAMHDDSPDPASAKGRLEWLVADAVPWMARRRLGRRAGDGRSAKHDGLVPVLPGQAKASAPVE
jgi:phosphatidylinositol alpha 1,6-mannosyltransferase